MDKIPAVMYLVRSCSRPQLAILCTEMHLAKWIKKILAKGEQPEVKRISAAELTQMIRPSHNLN